MFMERLFLYYELTLACGRRVDFDPEWWKETVSRFRFTCAGRYFLLRKWWKYTLEGVTRVDFSLGFWRKYVNRINRFLRVYFWDFAIFGPEIKNRFLLVFWAFVEEEYLSFSDSFWRERKRSQRARKGTHANVGTTVSTIYNSCAE